MCNNNEAADLGQWLELRINQMKNEPSYIPNIICYDVI